MDERDRENEPAHRSFRSSLPRTPGERAAHHFDVHAFHQERMRVVLEASCARALDGLDLGSATRPRAAAHADQIGDAGTLRTRRRSTSEKRTKQYPGKSGKALFATVLPSAPPLTVGRKVSTARPSGADRARASHDGAGVHHNQRGTVNVDAVIMANNDRIIRQFRLITESWWTA